MGNFGCDKVKWFTRGFEIGTPREWAVIPNRKKPGQEQPEPTTLFCDSQGNYVQGERAYIEHPLFAATIKNGMLLVEFNPSKLFHPFELTANPNQINEAATRVQGILKEKFSCDFDLHSAGIGRIDVTAQDRMRRIVPFYDDVIKAAKDSRRAPRTEYPNGFLIHNSQRELCTYDKGLKNAMDSQMKHPLPTDFMRCEARLLKSAAVKSHSPFATFGELLQKGEAGLMYTYSRNVAALLPLQQEIPFIEMGTLSDLLRQQITIHKQGQWLPVFIAILMNGNTNMPTARQFEALLMPLVTDNTLSIRTAQRKRNEYAAMLHKIETSRAQYFADKERNYADMHREFKEKLIEPYLIAL